MTKNRWTVEDKVQIVMELPTTSASTADICKKNMACRQTSSILGARNSLREARPP